MVDGFPAAVVFEGAGDSGAARGWLAWAWLEKTVDLDIRIVEVAHYQYLRLRINALDRIYGMLQHAHRRFPRPCARLCAATFRRHMHHEDMPNPVIPDSTFVMPDLIRDLEPNIQHIPCPDLRNPKRIDPYDPEDIFSIQQRDIDAAGVRAIAMHIAVADLGERRPVHQLRYHQAVFHLGEPYQRRQLAPGVASGEDSLHDSVALRLETLPRPVSFGPGRKLVVILQRVVMTVKKVLHIPEHRHHHNPNLTNRPPHHHPFLLEPLLS